MSGVSRGESNLASASADSAPENIDLQSRADPSGSQLQTVSTGDTQSRTDPSGITAPIISHPSLQSRADPEGSSAQTENLLAPRLDSSESMTRAEIEHRLAGQDQKLTMILSLLQSGHNPSSSQSRTASTSGERTTLATSLNLSDDKPETDVNFHGSGQEGKSVGQAKSNQHSPHDYVILHGSGQEENESTEVELFKTPSTDGSPLVLSQNKRSADPNAEELNGQTIIDGHKNPQLGQENMDVELARDGSLPSKATKTTNDSPAPPGTQDSEPGNVIVPNEATANAHMSDARERAFTILS